MAHKSGSKCLKDRLATLLQTLCVLMTMIAVRTAADEPSVGTDVSGDPTWDLDQLSRVRVEIAALDPKPAREQPAIVSVITQEEIARSGARDLLSVLDLVPGFSFAADIDNVVGAGFRGLWAYEGKILVLLDGIPVNDGLYGTVQFGNHYSAEQIRQVEIIRGPGSARYGGSAELAVISITTKGAEQNGGFLSVRPEVSARRVGNSVDGSVGYTLTNDVRLSLGFSYDDSLRSDRTYLAQNGARVDLADASQMESVMVNADLSWRDLDIRVIYDDQRFDNPIGFGNPTLQLPGGLWWEEFRSLMASAHYHLRPVEWLAVTPKLTLRHQTPWWLHTSPGQGDFQVNYQGLTFDLPANVSLGDRHRLLVGMTVQDEHAKAVQTSGFFGQKPAAIFFRGQPSVDYDDIAAYAQYDLDTPWANASFGGRYENHSFAGDALVPRLALTRTFRKSHVKLLFDQAFRTPNIENIQQRLVWSRISYEKTTSYQLELGYDPTEHWSLVGNLYYMRIRSPLAFTTIDNRSFGYLNGTPISSYGTELGLRYSNRQLTASLGYALYQADDQLSERGGLYGSSVSGLNLALPAHKFSLSGTVHLPWHLDWNLSGTYATAVRAWIFPGTEADLDPEFCLHTYLERTCRWGSIGIGVRNLTDTQVWMAQAYNGGAAPLPLASRTFFAKVTVRF